ncbi:peptidylprolyl isomerase [Alphaproteobacteria bacterium]|nr:peptidylprolyl isomerase [Alphaproteobacteria bacterium]
MTRFALLLAAAITACAAPAFAQEHPSAPDKDTERLAAQVGDYKITVDQVRRQYDGNKQLQLLPFEAAYPDIVDYFIDDKIIYDAALADKIDADPAVVRDMEAARRQVVVSAYIRAKVAAQLSPSRLKSMYRDYIKDNPPAEEVELSHILVPTEPEALAVVAALDGGAEFAVLARERSSDGSAAEGGRMGTFSRAQLPDAFADAAFKLKRGAYSKKPVKTRFGWHVIMVSERKRGANPSFETVEAALRQKFAQGAYDKIVKDLRSRAKIKRFKLEEGK